MFCSKCGHEMKEGIRFCPACGNPVKKIEGQSVEVREREKGSTLGQDEPYAAPQFSNLTTPKVEVEDNTADIVSTWSFVGWRIIEMIPIVGFIVMIVFALDKSERNRANYAKAYFLIMVIQILLFVLFYSTIVGFIMQLAR